MEFFEAKIICALPDDLSQMEFISFSQNSPNYVGYTNKTSEFHFYNTKLTCPLKSKTILDSIGTCFCLTDHACVTIGQQNGKVKIYDLDTNKCFYECQGHSQQVASCDITSWSRILVTSSFDRTIKIWDARKKGPIRTVELEKDVAASIVRLSPDASWFAASLSNSSTFIYDIQLGKSINIFNKTGKSAYINFHPDEMLMSTCSVEGELYFWDLVKFKSINAINIQSNPTCTWFHVPTSSLYIGDDHGKIITVPWKGKESRECILVEGSHIYDMGQKDDNFYFISKIDSNLSIIEGPFDVFADSEHILSPFISASFVSPNKTFDLSPNKLINSNSLSFKSIRFQANLQSTRIDAVVQSVVDFNELVNNFNEGHKKLCETINKRVRALELVCRMARLRNFHGALKTAEECPDKIVLVAILRNLIKNMPVIKEFPTKAIMKSLNHLLKISDFSEITCQLFCDFLKHVKPDTKLPNDILEMGKIIEKINSPDEHINLIKLLVNRF